MEEFGQARASQATVDPSASGTAGPVRVPRPAWDWRTGVVAIPLCLVSAYAFLPILGNDFVAWDDDQNFLANPYFRGLGAAQWRWAWTTFWVGVYQPLAWLLFEVQYSVCQLDPRGYHLTSLLVHVGNAVALYLLTLAMLVRCRADGCDSRQWTCSLSAGLATALFAVHPLRVEAVAWASGQPYLPCALFFMLSILAYLRAFPSDSATRWGWLAGSFFLFVVALLFKAAAVSLPAVLLILDVYLLGRIPDETGSWSKGRARRAWLEKVPFVIVSVCFMGVAIVARAQSPLLIERYAASEAIAQACYSIWFYIQKTALPLDLTVIYPLPKNLDWLAMPYCVSILATLAISASLFRLRSRWPGLWTAWLCYLVILAPNSGIIRNNIHVIAADRYTYISMLGWVVLVAAGLGWAGRIVSRLSPGGGVGVVVLGLGAIAGLTALTRNQCRSWHNSESLWTYALAHGAQKNPLAHNNLGDALERKGNYEAAAAHFTEALRFNPGLGEAHTNLGHIFYTQGKYAEAANHFNRAIWLDPANVTAHYDLGIVLAGVGNHAEAAAHFNEALRLEPGNDKVHNNLGSVLFSQGKHQEAADHYAEAVRLNSGNLQAHYNLGLVCSRLGNYAVARAQFAEAIGLDPGFVEAYNAIAMILAACPDAKFRNGDEAIRLATHACELTKWENPVALGALAAAEAEAGDFAAAVKVQNKAIELLPVKQQKEEYRSRRVLYQAKKPFRQAFP